VALTRARRRSSWPASFLAGGCPEGRGAISPVSRRRCLSRRTQDALTRCFSATSAVLSPASQSANTRTRKSIEYAFIAITRDFARNTYLTTVNRYSSLQNALAGDNSKCWLASGSEGRDMPLGKPAV
jgi:hypothetical protein